MVEKIFLYKFADIGKDMHCIPKVCCISSVPISVVHVCSSVFLACDAEKFLRTELKSCLARLGGSEFFHNSILGLTQLANIFHQVSSSYLAYS